MSDIYLTNSLTRKKEKFESITPNKVGMYTCGQTVYDFTHIGHGRKYTMDDVLKRALAFNGYEVKHVQNVTDVGHLVSDGDAGIDKLEKGSSKYGKDPWEVAKFFTEHFYNSMDKLNIIRADIICKATEHIPEQIQLIQTLIEKGFAYDTPEAVYFDTVKFKGYGEMFGQKLSDKQTKREDVVTGEFKKNQIDFALWVKRTGIHKDHIMHWDSPWGDGFPGWHIECSAMSMKYLGEQFDIHTGGEDHLAIHHPNEIAQSEAATGKHPFVKYWLHYAFLLVDGRKMSKSLENFYTLEDVEKKGFEPLALRYLYLTAHYRDPLNFTWESLQAAQNGLNNLRQLFLASKMQTDRTVLSEEKEQKVTDYSDRFTRAINDDLNTSAALAVLWETLKSNIPSEDKYDLAMSFDEVLGLGLNNIANTTNPTNIANDGLPGEVQWLVRDRDKAREEKDWGKSDELRQKIQELGYEVLDTGEGQEVRKKN
jgi:cysteinyl-tRNA synthetase